MRVMVGPIFPASSACCAGTFRKLLFGKGSVMVPGRMASDDVVRPLAATRRVFVRLLIVLALGLVTFAISGEAVRAQTAGGAAVDASATGVPADPLVSEIKSLLKSLGYQPGEINGVPDAPSRAAIREYQRDLGIAETGLFTPSLLRSLKQDATARQDSLQPNGKAPPVEGQSSLRTAPAEGRQAGPKPLKFSDAPLAPNDPPGKVEQTPSPQSAACVTPAAPRTKPSRVVVMLDTSGSMGLPPDAAMNELTDRVGQGDWLAVLEFKRLLFQTPRYLSRLGIAVTALQSLVDALPPERELGLVTSGRCEGPRQVGVFDAAHRLMLKQLADSIQPEEGTPLAAGLVAAGAMLEGEPSPLLVVITDGAETCGGDPCAEARALQSRMPELRINVVDLSGSNVAACLAQTTGGRVFAPDQAAQITANIGEAARTEPASCSP